MGSDSFDGMCKVIIDNIIIEKDSDYRLTLAPGGGQAIRFSPFQPK